MSMEMRSGRTEDAEIVAEVEAICFPPAEAAPLSEFEDRMARYPEHFRLLFDDGRLVSFVGGIATDEEDLTDEMFHNTAMHREDGAWKMIFSVATIPEYQKRGCAGRVLRSVIEEARQQGRRGLVLTCKDEKVAYYAKFGFVNEGHTDKSCHGGAVWNQMRLTF